MGEDSKPKSTTPLDYLNESEIEIEDEGEDDEDDEDTETDDDNIYIVRLEDVQGRHTDNAGDQYIDVDDNVNITVVNINKENLEEGTDIKEMIMSIYGNNNGFVDRKSF
jgi:hypothetical protein